MRMLLLVLLLVVRPTLGETLDRVSVIGASASAGFLASYETRNEFVRLAHVLDEALPDSRVVTSHADWNFFSKPRTFGPAMIDGAIADDPTCVIAIDYLFWYAYGVMGPTGVMRTTEDRLAMLDLGLEQLARLDCPILVGDIPDMRDAEGFMLGKAQIPSVEALDALNERLRTWAEGRPNVHVFPLDEMTRMLRSGKDIHIQGVDASEDEASSFLNVDRLHPTKQGQIFTVRVLAATLATLFEDVSPDDFDVTDLSTRLESRP
ncbi:MAG: hypothetical protein KDA28_16370 [Phycisphaerales bacterium]|nr:hypothetical protein [Phycisphaerales bacterium]